MRYKNIQNKENRLRKFLMIVEDFGFIENTVYQYFVKDGYELISARNMRQALTLGEWEQPEAIIIDYEMLLDDPYLIISVLHNALPSCQIILINGRIRFCDQQKALIAGANQVLMRIFNPSTLEGLIVHERY